MIAIINLRCFTDGIGLPTMSFPGLEKIGGRFFKKEATTEKGVDESPAQLDPQSRAKQDIAKEATVAPLWKEKLAKQFPDQASVIESMFRNFQEFAETGVTPETGYWDFRYLYFKTCGISNDEINSSLSTIF